MEQQEELNVKWALIEGSVDKILLPVDEPGVVVVPGIIPLNKFYVFCNSEELADKIYHNLQVEVSKIPANHLGVKVFGRVGDIKRPGVIIYTDPVDSADVDGEIQPLHLLMALAASGFRINEIGKRSWEQG